MGKQEGNLKRLNKPREDFKVYRQFGIALPTFDKFKESQRLLMEELGVNLDNSQALTEIINYYHRMKFETVKGNPIDGERRTQCR